MPLPVPGTGQTHGVSQSSGTVCERASGPDGHMSSWVWWDSAAQGGRSVAGEGTQHINDSEICLNFPHDLPSKAMYLDF